MRGLKSILISVIAVSGLLAGCDSSADHIGGKKRSKIIQRVVSLSPGTTELVSIGNGINLLRGRTKYCNFPPPAVKCPVVADVKPNYEQIKELQPDAIILDQALYSEQDIAKIRELGAQVIAINANTLSGFIDQVYSLGRDFHNETYISEYGDKIMQATEGARAYFAGRSIKVAILMPDASGAHMITGSESLLADILKQSGLTAVAPAGDKFVPLNAEFLLSQNPDVILTAGPSDALLKDSRLAGLNAVKDRHVIALNADIVLRRGSRVDVLIQGIGQAIKKSIDKK